MAGLNLGNPELIADKLSTLTGAAALDVSNRLLSNVTNPVSAQDAATKSYVDGSASSSKSRDATITIAPTGTAADYNTTGTNDGLVIITALAALPAGGGRILYRNGTYNFNSSSDRARITKSNVVFEGETPGGVIFKAIASLHPGGSDSLGQFGMLQVGVSNSTKISDIVVRNIVFNCNNQDKTSGLTLDGSSSMTGQIGVQNVTVENCKVINACSADTDVVKAGFFLHSGVNQAVGNRGYLDNVTIRNVEVGPSNTRGMYFQGGNFTNIKVIDCQIHDCNRDGMYYVNYDGSPTSANWLVSRVRFYNNMILTSGSSMAHFRDSTQNGIDNLAIENCYFGPAVNANASQDYSLTPYWASNLRIEGNFFDRVGSGVSLGASISGSYAKNFPINKMQFINNTFYQARSCFDPDSAVFGLFKGNIFYEVRTQELFGSYSRHFPTVYEGNIMYNCHTDTTGSESAYHLAAIQTAADGFVIRNNYIIDDRKLSDPTGNLTLTATAGGALAARTYYVRYTWSNSTGETLGSTQQSLAVGANNLLNINYGGSAVPTGAKKMNIYIGTTNGSAWTLQTSIDLPTKSFLWVEPTTGLIAGTAYPTSNTTTTKTLYGIYENTGGVTTSYANVYSNNHFIGITPANCIVENGSYRRLRTDNTCEYSGAAQYLDTLDGGSA